jgi:hypothetical protein
VLKHINVVKKEFKMFVLPSLVVLDIVLNNTKKKKL